MSKEQFIASLRQSIRYKYNDAESEAVWGDYKQSSPAIRSAIEHFLTTGEVQNAEVEGYTVERLKEEFGMNEVAAFLNLDWLTKEPEEAKGALKRGYDKIITE